MADKDPLILDFRNGRVLEGAGLDEYYVSGLDDGPANWDDIDLEDAFDLPPGAPAVADGLDLERHGPALVTRLFLSLAGRRSDHPAGRRHQGCRDGRPGGAGGRQAVAGMGRCPR